MKAAARQPEPESVLLELIQAAGSGGDPGTLEAFVAGHRELLRPEMVEKLADLSRGKLHVNAHESLQLAEAALTIARAIGDEESQARGLRAKANASWFLNQNRQAVALYDQAIAIWEKCENETEVGRTLSSSIQPLIRLGEYDRAIEGAERARRVFSRSGDTLRLARLELNAANIYHRQDRFAEALEGYEHAYRQLLPFRDTEAIGAALHNMAVCLIATNDYPRALATHQAARAFCQENGMPALVVQADYNVAYLHYLRGEYSRALDGLRAARVAAAETGDAYHVALCSMDQSEIYLHLNMSDEAAEMAQEAYGQFQDLGMNYESAKSLVNLAIALGRPGSVARSLELFSRARRMFVQEQNQAWPSLIDLYQALALYDAGSYQGARPLCLNALEFFRFRQMGSKEILCQLLLARICLRTGEAAGARLHCETALGRLETVEAAHLVYQAHILMGQIEESEGAFERAAEGYRAACSTAESVRGVLRGEELKIAFMKNKLEVYESLIRLCLNRAGGGGCPAREIFDYMEQAKSRSLRDLIGAPAEASLAGHGPAQSRVKEELTGPAGAQAGDLAHELQSNRIQDLRDELNWYYNRFELEQLGQEAASEKSLERLRTEARDRERELLRLVRERPASDVECAGTHNAPALTVETIRAALGPDAALVEYFRTGDRLIAAVLSADVLEVVPLCKVSRVAPLVRLLQFQFSKFRLGADYVNTCGETMLRATRAHLRELYEALMEPVRRHLRGHRHLVLVPHESLHHLPLHALFDGNQYLIDAFTVSYAPSASIYALCRQQPVNTDGVSLILGVPDEQAPLIAEEAAIVAATLPQPELFLGADASRQILRERGPASRVIHISTHGRFRGDNPMFSAIRLGDGYLTLYDLYRFRLPAELVTLSGCSTGLNVIAKGDELLGLVRGLLHAGARSLLLSLWDVEDRGAAELMQAFYERFPARSGLAAALQGAMLELRERYPHPYFWAPFVLIGSSK